MTHIYRTLNQVTAPPETPVTLAEAKEHVRQDAADDDAKITALLNAAVARIDGPGGILGRAIVEQQWDMKLDCFPEHGEAIKVPLPPLISIDQITYLDTTGASQTLDTSNYQIAGVGPDARGCVFEAYGTNWPATRRIPEAVTVRFTCGYEKTAGSPTDYRENIPDDIRQALLIMIAEWYENREETVIGAGVNPVPYSAMVLLTPKKARWF